MKIKNNILTLMAAALLTACSSDELSTPAYTVGEADNAITLGAGIAEGGSGVTSRAVDGNHSKHVAFSTEHTTQLRLRVDGKWRKSGSSTEDISKATTATTGEKTGKDNLHNKLSFSPMLYWDDYGTADPENMSTAKGGTVTDNTDGRGIGLTVYGVGVNEKNLPTSVIDGRTALSNLSTSSGFTNITWNVGSVSSGTIDQSTTGWGDYDLITSNNIKDGTGFDGTLKFDDTKQGSTTPPSNLLEFTHAMSKITVVLTAGEGFPGYETNANDAKFEAAPKVTLLNFNYTGTVDVENKTSTPPATTTIADIKAWRDKGAAWPTGGQHTSTLEAIVFPGNSWTSSNKTSSNILELDADGNIYKVTAEKLYDAINAAITSANHPGTLNGTLSLTQGWNYKIQITVNKTEIQVTATVENWKDVTADPAYPEIDVTMAPGSIGTENTSNAYSFFISTTKEKGYGIANASPATYYNQNSELSYNTSAWELTPKLYWPNHHTHYHMRGIYPKVGTSGETTKPVVVESGSKQYVAVSNDAYNATTFPSNFMIGKPEIADADKMCGSTSHTSVDMNQDGICATEGKINLNFRYMMSQVVVNLKTNPEDGAANKVDFGTKDQLSEAEVKILNGYTQGNVLLGSMEYDFTGKTPTDFLMTATTDVQRHNAVCAQSLEGLKFQITIKNASGATDDVYTVDVKDILVKEPEDTTPKQITSWDPGKKYIYELYITKTEIKVTATITDWTTVNADQNVWF